MKRTVILFSFILLSLAPGYTSSSGVKVLSPSSRMYSNSFNRFKLTTTGTDLNLPDTINQKVVKKSCGKEGCTLVLSTGNYTTGSKFTYREGTFTGDTLMGDYSENNIQQLLNSLPAATTPYELEKLVNELITNKMYGIGMLQASSILRYKRGDCSEHAVLLTALLRGMNIPARAVVGMILSPEFEGEEDTFVFHMWVEAWYKGKWILLDATRPGEVSYSRYISFAYHNLMSEMPLAVARVSSEINGVKVTFIDLK